MHDMAVFTRFVILYIIAGITFAHQYVSKPTNVLISEAFFIPVEREWFKSYFSHEDEVEFTVSLLDMPDLPNWMFSRHPNSSQNAFLYGSADEIGSLDIEIIALSKNTYKTAQKVMKLNVEPRENIASYEVEMKFLNLNVEDMFKANRLDRLLELFRSFLWKESETLYVTKVVSSLDVGGRLPLNPSEKEGVVVRIGGSSNFARTLQDLEREVQPLRNRFPCPRDYKRTSVEHLFRKRNFIADWCSFRLVSSKRDESADSTREWSNPSYSSVSLSSDDFKPQSVHVPRRDFLFDFILSIVAPSAVVAILSTALTCIMCCNRDGPDSKVNTNSKNATETIMVERNGLPGSRSSIPLSTRDSPVSTLQKSSGTRPPSRTGTLKGLMLPPPPPYTPSSVGSKRAITTLPML